MDTKVLKNSKKYWEGILETLIILVWIWIIWVDWYIHSTNWWGWIEWWMFTWWTIFWLILIEFSYVLKGGGSGESAIWHAYGWMLLNIFIICPGIVLAIFEPSTWIAWFSMIIVWVSVFIVFITWIWFSKYNIQSSLRTIIVWVIVILSCNYTATLETETFYESLPRWIIISLVSVIWIGSYLGDQIKKLRFRHDHVLKFNTYGVSIQLHEVSDVTIFQETYLDEWELAWKKTQEDESSYPEPWFSLDRFPKVDFKWESRDGDTHEYIIDLNTLFKDRRVLHTEDPKLIYTPDPISRGEPTIIFEINNRTLNIYMFVTIQVFDPSTKKGAEHDHRTLVFTKTF